MMHKMGKPGRPGLGSAAGRPIGSAVMPGPNRLSAPQPMPQRNQLSAPMPMPQQRPSQPMSQPPGLVGMGPPPQQQPPSLVGLGPPGMPGQAQQPSISPGLVGALRGRR